MAPSIGCPSLYHVTFKSIEAVALQVSTTWVPVFTSVEIGFKVIVGASEKTKIHFQCEALAKRTCDGWPNGLASRRKFAKPKLAHGLVMGGQTDSQVGSQVHASFKKSKFRAYTVDLLSTCVDLRWVAKR